MDSIDWLLGSGIPYITYAVPVFFLLILVEIVFGYREHRELYRLNDSINDLSCGIIQQIIGIFTKTAFFVGYLWLYEHCRLLEIAEWPIAAKWAAAVGLFLGVDLAYYWFHRIAHEMNAPWATHVVHHQSEEYNLSVALRQGTFQDVFSWAFYTPLVIIGFPPLWLLAMKSFDTLYQFWIHTRAIGRMGPLEWVFNTPSHHRVHHARNPKYLDKNYAGTLIIWDRMFGTFVPEEEEPVYGLTKPLNSWNPIWANLHIWYELCRDAWLAPHWRDKLRIWFMPPGWRPEGLPENPPGAFVTRETVIKFDTTIPRGLAAYVTVQFTATLCVAVALMVVAPRGVLSLGMTVGLTLWVLLALANCGAIYERRRWALASELARLALAAGLSFAWAVGAVDPPMGDLPAWLLVAAGTFFAASIVVFLSQTRELTGRVTYRGGRAPCVLPAPEPGAIRGAPAQFLPDASGKEGVLA
ncbi:MAG: sterol desaturase family protein [Pirellulales bacterium]|nr:sterol desaturase family protein [Pirellulales bacterium]